MPRYMILHKCDHCKAVDLFTFTAEQPITKEIHVRPVQPPTEGMCVTDGSEGAESEDEIPQTPTETPMVPPQGPVRVLVDFHY